MNPDKPVIPNPLRPDQLLSIRQWRRRVLAILAVLTVLPASVGFVAGRASAAPAPPLYVLEAVSTDIAYRTMRAADDDLSRLWVSSLSPRRAVAAAVGREVGRHRPVRLPGFPAWRCAVAPTSVLTCAVAVVGPERAWRALVRYTAFKQSAEVRVVVMPA